MIFLNVLYFKESIKSKFKNKHFLPKNLHPSFKITVSLTPKHGKIVHHCVYMLLFQKMVDRFCLPDVPRLTFHNINRR